MSHPEQVTASSVLANGRRQNGGSECQVMKKEDLSSTTVLESDIVPDCVPQLADGEDSPQQTVYGPLSKEETEQLQLEANEETTKSEDLRLFLQEMRQHVSQQTQLQQQQHQQHHHHSQQIGSATQMCGSAYDHLKGSSAVSHQLQHQTLTRGVGGAQQSGALAAQKRSMLADQDYIMDTAPDGGWGWIVVFSSFVCMILVDGISLCYGLLVAPTCPGNSLQALEKAHPKPLTATSLGILWPSKAREIPVRAGSCVGISEMGEALGTQSRSALMIPGGLLVGIYLLLGPLASALSNQFDFRPVAMAGGVVSTIGLVAAAFSTNVQVLHGTLGIIGGIGFGLIYLPAIATVGHWFKRRRPFAVGLALCGSGVGTVIGGQVLPLLVNWFTWSGTLIVLAAFCLQCLTLIVLFRPLDLHLRIKHYQRVRRQAAWDRERQRNADTRVHEQRVRRRALKIDVESTTKAHAAAIAAAARAQASQARAAKKALKAQKAQQRRVIYRGSIMQRIIEEKRRQRTVSVGSLDGMVITRDNELIAAPLVADRPPILTAASITRISEAVMRKMEARLAGWHDGGTIASGGGGGAGVITDTPTPVRCDSNTSQPPLEVLNADTRTSSPSRKSSGLTSHAALSRLNLVRESLPQLVQDYVQSQASIAVQNYIAKQHSQMLQSSGVGATVGAVHAPGGTTDTTGISPHTRIRSISNATNIYPSGGSSTPQAQKARMLSSHLQSRDLTISNTQSDQDGAAQSSMNGDPNITGPLASPPSPTRNLFIPSTCASECLSLRRTISDASLTSSNRGLLINVPLEIRNEVAELLDGEVRAEVNQRLRREMMRPQYKKDLFFTGSAQQLDHTPISAIPLGGVGNVWTTRDHSNWDVGLTNNASTPNATISNRGLGVDADGHVDAKTSITSAQQKLSVSVVNAASSAAAAAGGKGSGDPADHQSVRVVDYGDDLSITPQPPVAVRKRSCCSSPILTFLEELLAPGLLLSPTFISLLLSNIFTIWGLVIPYFMFPDIAAENNWTPAEAGSLISYIGLANTFGRCIATLYIEKAWSSHYKWADCLRVNVGSLLLSSFACAVVPLIGHNYNLMIFAGCVFGLFSAVVVSLKSILVVELFGLDKLTNAFGHMLVVQGLSSIAGALVGGRLFDVFAAGAPEFTPWAGNSAPLVHAADTCFYFAGASFLLAALFASPLRCLAVREVISATYSSTPPGVLGAGGVYIDDYLDYGEGGGGFDESSIPAAEALTAANSIANVQSPSSNAGPSVLGQPQTYDLGMASHICEAPSSVGGPAAEPSEPPPSETSTAQPSTATTTFLSPAPLPSSLFLTPDTEMQQQGQQQVSVSDNPDVEKLVGLVDDHGDLTAGEETAGVITTAGVPIGNLPTRAVVPPPQESTIAWTASSTSTVSSAPTEVKTTIVAEEPALEPVKEEEEEDLEDSALPHSPQPPANTAGPDTAP